MRYILEERLAFYTKKDRARKETYLKRYYILHEQEKHLRKKKKGKQKEQSKFIKNTDVGF
jgi:hypothetical protein